MSALAASVAWTATYSTAGNLLTVTTPTTPDQTSGITTTFGYDGSNRLTSVQDGRGNTVYSIAYVGSTGQVDSITINGDTVDYAYPTSTRTERTDRNGVRCNEMISGSPSQRPGGRGGGRLFVESRREEGLWEPRQGRRARVAG